MTKPRDLAKPPAPRVLPLPPRLNIVAALCGDSGFRELLLALYAGREVLTTRFLTVRYYENLTMADAFVGAGVEAGWIELGPAPMGSVACRVSLVDLTDQNEEKTRWEYAKGRVRPELPRTPAELAAHRALPRGVA